MRKFYLYFIGTLVIKAPDTNGEHEINFLFYYDSNSKLSTQKKQALPYRIHTHTSYIQVLPSIILTFHSLLIATIESILYVSGEPSFPIFSITNDP